MRRMCLSVLMIILLLTGCGESGELEQKIDALRRTLDGAGKLSFTAEVTADLGESQFTCTLRCTAAAEETVLTVTEPEIIAGVTARLGGGETKLEYDGVELAVGATEGGFTPVGAVPVLLEAVRSGHVTQCWREKAGEEELLAARTYIDESSYALLWFREESMEPVYGELVTGDRAVIQCAISEFTIQ